MRTPLNQIIGYSEMLMEQAQDQGNDALCADLQKTQTAGKQLLTIIEESFYPVRAAEALGAAWMPSEEPFIPAARQPNSVAEALGHSPEEGERDSETLAARLLVVDDIESNRDVLSRRLERLGYVVATAENGREALERLAARNDSIWCSWIS